MTWSELHCFFLCIVFVLLWCLSWQFWGTQDIIFILINYGPTQIFCFNFYCRVNVGLFLPQGRLSVCVDKKYVNTNKDWPTDPKSENTCIQPLTKKKKGWPNIFRKSHPIFDLHSSCIGNWMAFMPKVDGRSMFEGCTMFGRFCMKTCILLVSHALKVPDRNPIPQ